MMCRTSHILNMSSKWDSLKWLDKWSAVPPYHITFCKDREAALGKLSDGSHGNMHLLCYSNPRHTMYAHPLHTLQSLR